MAREERTLRQAMAALNSKYTKDGSVTPALLRDVFVAALIGIKDDDQKPKTPKSTNIKQFLKYLGAEHVIYLDKVLDLVKIDVKKEEEERLAKEKKAIIARKKKEMIALEAELKALLEE